MSDQILRNQLLELVQGDDYLAVDGRAVVLVGGGMRWPAAVASVKLLAYNPAPCCCGVSTAPAAVLDVTGDYTAPALNAAAKCSFDLTNAITLTLARGVRRYDFEIRATLLNGHLVTLANGMITVT